MGRLKASETALFVCDVQERFKPIISGMPVIIDTARRMVRGAEALQIPIIVTEQYPKALGRTVDEVKEVLPKDAFVQDKTDFTMFGTSPAHMYSTPKCLLGNMTTQVTPSHA